MVESLQEPPEIVSMCVEASAYINRLAELARMKIEQWDIGDIPSREEFP